MQRFNAACVLSRVLCFVPNIIFSYALGQSNSYLPFQTVLTTKEVLASGAIGFTFEGMIEMLAILIIIYGMLFNDED